MHYAEVVDVPHGVQHHAEGVACLLLAVEFLFVLWSSKTTQSSNIARIFTPVYVYDHYRCTAISVCVVVVKNLLAHRLSRMKIHRKYC